MGILNQTNLTAAAKACEEGRVGLFWLLHNGFPELVYIRSRCDERNRDPFGQSFSSSDSSFNPVGKRGTQNVSPKYQIMSTTPPTPKVVDGTQTLILQILLATVMVLIAICFILGVVLIVKSYMMAPLKQNLATAIRRRRRVGHAPDNQYIRPADMRVSRPTSDRKSYPPPEVLMAARERASQILHV